ncbi:hypothetical protein A0H81_14082 [Grifola frondosa]|uniref:Uncharacterized protein n=1 Tax=Grifola frondosa TaxID=5627 RepID=A0A1C7LMK8_GRIFR|nr:hypothetical protein A0H81_14082 [Grifola frondosa]
MADPHNIPVNARHLNPASLAALRDCLGRDARYNLYQDRFDIADLAWFVAGAHVDGTHNTSIDHFHEAFRITRQGGATGAEGARVRREFCEKLMGAVLDFLTVWDRVSGGVSIMIHIDGAQPPGSLLLPEHVKAHAYFNPALMAELPGARVSVARLAQQFIVDLGVPAVARWTRAFKNEGYNLPRGQTQEAPSISSIVPQSSPGSSHYLCFGQSSMEFDRLLQAYVNSSATNSSFPAVSGVFYVPASMSSASQPVLTTTTPQSARTAPASQPAPLRTSTPEPGATLTVRAARTAPETPRRVVEVSDAESDATDVELQILQSRIEVKRLRATLESSTRNVLNTGVGVEHHAGSQLPTGTPSRTGVGVEHRAVADEHPSMTDAGVEHHAGLQSPTRTLSTIGAGMERHAVTNALPLEEITSYAASVTDIILRFTSNN